MLPIIKNRVNELKAWLDESENKRLEIKKAAIASGDLDGYIKAHRDEITPWREEDEEKDACYRMLTAPILYSDDKDVVRGYLKWQFDFIRELDKISKNPALAKSRAARINEITRLLEAIEEEE